MRALDFLRRWLWRQLKSASSRSRWLGSFGIWWRVFFFFFWSLWYVADFLLILFAQVPSVSNVQYEPILVQIDRFDLVLEENVDPDNAKSPTRWACLIQHQASERALFPSWVLMFFWSASTSTGTTKGSGYGFADKVKKYRHLWVLFLFYIYQFLLYLFICVCVLFNGLNKSIHVGEFFRLKATYMTLDDFYQLCMTWYLAWTHTRRNNSEAERKTQ